MATRLELTKQLHDKRKEAALVLMNPVVGDDLRDREVVRQKFEGLMVEINSLKAQLEKLGSN